MAEVLEQKSVMPPAVSHSRNAIRILAVDDSSRFRSGIAALLATQPDMNLVAEASNGRAAIEQFRAHWPDITLLDLQMPEQNGLAALTAIRGEFPEARIIILTTFAGDREIRQALEAGARAYILKTTPPSEMLHIIREVHAGEKGFLPS